MYQAKQAITPTLVRPKMANTENFVVFNNAASLDLSSILECGGMTPCAIYLPANFVSTQLTFLAGDDLSRIGPINDPSSYSTTTAPYTVSATAGFGWYPVPIVVSALAKYFQILCTDPQPQGLEIYVAMGPYWG